MSLLKTFTVGSDVQPTTVPDAGVHGVLCVAHYYVAGILHRIRTFPDRPCDLVEAGNRLGLVFNAGNLSFIKEDSAPILRPQSCTS
jgi:hypothetical protein